VIQQSYPLYTTILGEDFLIVGWTEDAYPMLAPLTTADRIRIRRVPDLKYRLVR
jgi:hypothetical protein